MICCMTKCNDGPGLVLICDLFAEIGLSPSCGRFHRAFAAGVTCRYWVLAPPEPGLVQFGTCMCSTC